MWAIHLGNQTIAEILIAKSDNIDAEDDTGWTTLTCAARYGAPEMAKGRDSTVYGAKV